MNISYPVAFQPYVTNQQDLGQQPVCSCLAEEANRGEEICHVTAVTHLAGRLLAGL